MESKELLIVGAGGIGSWLTFFLYNLKQADQLNHVNIHVADDDTVDVKNLTYQNFSEEDLLELKADVLANRYHTHSITERISDLEQLKSFDIVISAVDNTTFRRMIFENIPDNSFYWIDLRSEGNNISAYSKGADKQQMLESVAVDAEDKSCQRQWELEQGIIHNGNKIVASIGSQYVLNWYRGDMNKKSFNTMF